METQISIRGIDEKTVETLKKKADKSRRSLNQYIIWVLEQDARKVEKGN